MPRDLQLEPEESTIDDLAPLSREAHLSPEDVQPGIAESLNLPLHSSPPPVDMPDSPKDLLRKNLLDDDRRGQLHPFVQTLNRSHVDSCVVVEDVAFPENERCSREKFQYRLTTCGELSLGLFTCVTKHAPPSAANANDSEDEAPTPNPLFDQIPTAAVSPEISSSGPPRKRLLVGHVIATLSANPSIKDADMDVPESWCTSPNNPNSFLLLPSSSEQADDPSISSSASELDSKPAGTTTTDASEEPPQPPSDPPPPPPARSPAKGHNPRGRTLCIHSLAVLPRQQRHGLGSVLRRSYLSRIEGAGVADRVALLAHEPMVPYYQRFGFRRAAECDEDGKEAKSEVTFGGGGWVDMVLEFARPSEPPVTTLVGRNG